VEVVVNRTSVRPAVVSADWTNQGRVS